MSPASNTPQALGDGVGYDGRGDEGDRPRRGREPRGESRKPRARTKPAQAPGGQRQDPNMGTQGPGRTMAPPVTESPNQYTPPGTMRGIVPSESPNQLGPMVGGFRPIPMPPIADPAGPSTIGGALPPAFNPNIGSIVGDLARGARPALPPAPSGNLAGALAGAVPPMRTAPAPAPQPMTAPRGNPRMAENFDGVRVREHFRKRASYDGKKKPMIKPSHKGLLHKKLGVPQGQPIPKDKIAAAKNSSSPSLVKEATFAQNFGK